MVNSTKHTICSPIDSSSKIYGSAGVGLLVELARVAYEKVEQISNLCCFKLLLL